mgnify:CR=1 FL=1
MESKHLNRIKVALAEKEKTNKWLAEQLGKDQAGDEYNATQFGNAVANCKSTGSKC